MNIVIGTRGSKLALAQAEYVRNVLKGACPGDSFEIRVITTRGDRITDRPLHQIGGKGLFVREIEEQLRSGQIQLAVHSMKDMPAVPAEGLTFTKAWRREDPRDVLILREKSSLAELPSGAVIGTGSIRRQALLHRLRPDLRCAGIRGNVDTRLRKMEEQNLDGIVLAAAGLHRLGLKERITQYLSLEEMIPSPAQGILALEIRQDAYGLREILDQLAEEESEFAAQAEREFLRLCGGDCHMPVGAVCRRQPSGSYRLRAVFGDREGKNLSFADAEGTDAKELAEDAATQIGVFHKKEGRSAGTVYLTGAGPGDPGLITVRGMELLRQADCVVYDRLVSEELLRETKPECERIYVGKEKHHHIMGQAEIQDLLVRKAGEHARVLRLKGGDPFVFGRGGEEALALLEHGIRVEVIPGVTSAVAGAACAGIPVTHRGVSGGFHVVTAHDQRDALADIDFGAMVKSGDTCIFLMGLGNLPEIVEQLIEAGMPQNMAAAVISRATLVDQKVCQGTLSDIVSKVQEQSMPSPALIVVGEVVKLRRKLVSLERRQRSCSCLVPKIGEETTVLTRRLRERGIRTDEVQVGEIRYLDWKKESDIEERPDWLIFTSRHGVEGFFYGITMAGCDVRTFVGSRIAAIGAKTAQTLRRYGLQTDLLPETADSTALCRALRKAVRREDRVWYLTAEEGSRVVMEELSGCCHLTEKRVYVNCQMEIRIPSGAYDAIAFTCASSVRRLSDAGWVPGESTYYSIGPMCTEQMRCLGIEDIIQADHASYEALAEKIYETLREGKI